MIPRSCAAITTPPMSSVVARERALERPLLALPDPGGRAVQQDQEPDRHRHDGERLRARHGVDHEPLDHDAADERDHEREEEGDPVRHAAVEQLPADEGREHRHLALREVDDARRAVDQDEREREQRVHAARRDPRDDLLENVGHSVAQVRLLGRTRCRAARRRFPRPRRGRPRARSRAPSARARRSRSARPRARTSRARRSTRAARRRAASRSAARARATARRRGSAADAP